MGTDLAERIPSIIGPDLEEFEQRVEFHNAIHHRSASQTPTILRTKLVASFGSLSILVLDALSFIKDDPMKLGLGRMEQRTLDGKVTIVEIQVSSCVFFYPLLVTLQLCGKRAVSCQNDIKSHQLVGR